MNSEAGFWWGLVVATLSGSVLAADPVRAADAGMFPARVAYEPAIPARKGFLERLKDPLGIRAMKRLQDMVVEVRGE